VEKYCGTGQATDDNVAHAHCMLDTYGYLCTPVVSYSLFFHRNSGCTNAPQCYVVRTLPLSLTLNLMAHARP